MAEGRNSANVAKTMKLQADNNLAIGTIASTSAAKVESTDAASLGESIN